MNQRFRLVLLLAASFATAAVSPLAREAQAATYTWDTTIVNGVITGGAGTWNTSDLNWTLDGGATNGPWTNSVSTPDSAIFGGGTGAAGTVTTNGIINVDDLTFTAASSGNYTITGALTLGDTGAGITTPTINVNTGVSPTISAVLSGNDGLVKSGAGTLTLNAGNDYTGTTSIFAGTLSAGSIVVSGGVSNLGNTTSAVVLGDGTNQGTLSYTGGAANYTRGFAVNAGGGQLVHAGTASTLTVSASGITAVGMFTVNADSGNNVTISSLISGGGGLTKTGAGMLTLTAVNGYTGGTFVTGGILNLDSTGKGNPSAILTGNSNLTVTGATVNLIGNVSNTIFNPGGGTITLNAGGTLSANTTGANAHNVFDIVMNGGTLTATTAPGGAHYYVNGSIRATDNSTISATIGRNSGSAILAIDVSNGKTLSVTGQIVNLAGANGLTKTGLGTLALSNVNTYTGNTTISAGTLNLDYTAVSSRIADTGVLVFAGGTLNLANGASAHNEVVGSTTINAGASTVTRTSGSSVLRLNAITRNSGGMINFTAPGIADTDTTNTNGILGFWATVGGNDWAVNSTNGADGAIVAYSAYTDVTRLSSGTKVIADDGTSNVRLVEGAGATGDITLGAAATTIYTLNQSNSGGAGAATIDPAGQTLAVNNILIGSSAGGLTIGNGVNNGTLTSATSGGNLILTNHSANLLTVNSTIADNTTASGLVKTGTGDMVLTGANSYTGTTSIFGGTVSTSSIVVVGGVSSLGNAASAVVLGDGNTQGTLSYTGGAATYTRGLTINAGGGQLVHAGTASTLTVSTGGIAAGGMFTVDGVAGNNISITSAISGTGGLTKTGAGTLTLSAVNSYTGGTFVTGGNLILSGAGGNPVRNLPQNSNLTVTNATVTIAGGTNTIFNQSAGTIALNAGATLTSAGGQHNVYSVVMNGGTLAGSQFFFNSGISVTESSTISANFGRANVTNAALNIDVASGKTLLVSGTIVNLAGVNGLNKTGTGTLTLTGSNTYTGTTNVTGGILNLNAAGHGPGVPAIPPQTNLVVTGATVNLIGGGSNAIFNTTAGTITLNSGGTLSANGIAGSNAHNILNVVLNGGTLANVTSTFLNAHYYVNGSISATENSTISAIVGRNAGGAQPVDVTNGKTLLVTGTFVDLGGAKGLTKTGAGTLTLTGANTYTGATTISGVLQLGNGGNSGTLATASAITNNGTLAINRGDSVVQGTDFSDAAITGSGGFTQAGSGTTTLTANNTYAGTTAVNGGYLFVNGNNSGTGSYTVAGTATLGGTGIIAGAITVGNGGILAPGASIESLVSGDLTMDGGSIFAFEAANNSAIGADLMAVGALSLNGATLNLNGANLSDVSWLPGDKLTLISYTGAAVNSGFAGYIDDAAYLFGTNSWTLNYNDAVKGANFASDANGTQFVTLTLAVPVPEPSTMLVGGVALLGFIGMRLRRRRIRA